MTDGKAMTKDESTKAAVLREHLVAEKIVVRDWLKTLPVCADKAAIFECFTLTVNELAHLYALGAASSQAKVRELESANAWRPTHRHIKSGKLYRLISDSAMEVTRDREVMSAVYVDETGQVFVQMIGRFMDGRFESLPTPPSTHEVG